LVEKKEIQRYFGAGDASPALVSGHASNSHDPFNPKSCFRFLENNYRFFSFDFVINKKYDHNLVCKNKSQISFDHILTENILKKISSHPFVFCTSYFETFQNDDFATKIFSSETHKI